MNNAQEITKEIERHAHAMSGIVAQLKADILALPDNPRIQRVSGNPHCFVMSSSHLGNNWSAEHHDFKKQYELVVRQLEGSPDVVNKLLRIVNDGKVKLGGCFHETVRLHDDVIQHLSDLGGFRWKSHVKWEPGTCAAIGDESDDWHYSRKAAESVCRSLKAEGFGGLRQKFPVKTYVRAVIAQ